MSAHRIKRVAQHPALVVQYRPADAVRKHGDAWLSCPEVWNVSPATNIALKERGPDDKDYFLMRGMERGEIARCDE